MRVLLGVSFLFAVACAPDSGPAPADLVIQGARVLTLDAANPEVGALAVAGNKILQRAPQRRFRT